MAIRKLSANFLVACIVCFVATNVVQFCAGSSELCPDEGELHQWFAGVNTSWKEGACPQNGAQICVNASEDSTTSSSSDTTTLGSSMATETALSPVGHNVTRVRLVYCAFCPPGEYLSNASDTTPSTADTNSTSADTNSSSAGTTSSSTGTTSSSPVASSSTEDTMTRRYRCRPCTDGINASICPQPSPKDQPQIQMYIIIGSVVGGVVLLVVIISVTVVCWRRRLCCCQGRRDMEPPVSLQISVDGKNKDLENVEAGMRNKNRKGRYTPMPGSQMGQSCSNPEESEVKNLPMAPPPPAQKSKRLSVKIQQLRSWKRSTKKQKEEQDKKEGKDGTGYITMGNIAASRLPPSSSAEPLYQNQDNVIGNRNADEQEIYANEDQQEIYENQAVDEEQEIYENQSVLESSIQVSGGQLPSPSAAAVDGEETYYNVGEEDYENLDSRHK